MTWVVAGDDALLAFLTDAGWDADSAHRELDLDGTGATRVKQVRLHTRSREPAPASPGRRSPPASFPSDAGGPTPLRAGQLTLTALQAAATVL